MRVDVECQADERGDPMPHLILMDGRRIAVDEILDRWPGGDYRYFKLRDQDGNIYILRLDEQLAEWDLTMFQKPAAPAS